jgi:hypothetical protein
MPAIALWQPWSTLVAYQVKRFEFRSWPAPARLWGKRIAIHASARPIKRAEVQELILRLRHGAADELALDPGPALHVLEQALSTPGVCPCSAIECTAVLGEPIRNEELAARLGCEFVNDSDRSEHSNWGWPLSDIRRFTKPILARGAQGFRTAHIPKGAK